MKHIFVINPKAGKTDRSNEIRREIESLAIEMGLTFECILTRAPMDAADLVRREAEKGNSLRVYACGGDGTLNEAVNGAAGFPNAAVTHYPTGSGNDFIRIFGRDAKRFTDLKELVTGETAEFDLIDCNGRLCLNICSVGLDARIAAGMQYIKKLPFLSGSGAYALSTLYHVLRGIHRPYEGEVDGRPFSGNFSMLVAASGRYYGGGMYVLPEAEPDDGLIEFLLVREVSVFTVAEVIGDYKTGNYRKHPDIAAHLTGRQMTILSKKGQTAINVDGEVMWGSKIHLFISPSKVRFIFPRGARWKSTFTTDPA